LYGGDADIEIGSCPSIVCFNDCALFIHHSLLEINHYIPQRKYLDGSIMARMTLQLDSAFDKYDVNSDGILTDEEIAQAVAAADAENKDKREDQQRRMAWVCLISVVALTALLLTPIISVERVDALADLLGMFYIAMAGIMAAFFGSAAYMMVNR
jgi:hypothetical protein